MMFTDGILLLLLLLFLGNCRRKRERTGMRKLKDSEMIQ